ncbi:ABC transporter ATP-binding protein [Candidatus Riflebacteria bacterium]
MQTENIIEIKDLTVSYKIKVGEIVTVDQVSLGFEKGKVTALIGESGCGKTTLTNAIMDVLPLNASISKRSRVLFAGKDITESTEEEKRMFRWRKASIVFQAAQSALNPLANLSEQLTDSIFDHNPGISQSKAEEKIIELLELVRLEPGRVLDAYPHELSGGMRQRVIIAMSMVLDPEFIFLDEPTTALDTITQSYIFSILTDIHANRNLSMVLITHDMAAAAKLSENIVVMYGGRVMEINKTRKVFSNPQHPYTQGLINSMPVIDGENVKKVPIKGAPPDMLNPPEGCIFSPRCPEVKKHCKFGKPDFVESEGALVSCFLRGKKNA